jgi:hypothetical protein
MPAIAALTINDGAASPVAHTFAVGGTDGTTGKFADKVSGVPAGYTKITHEFREAKSAGGAHSVILGFSAPILGTVNGVTQVVRTSNAQVRLNFAQDGTDAERKDLVAYIYNYIGNATVRPAIYNLDPWY